MRDPDHLKLVTMAEDLASDVYDLSLCFVKEERYGLSSQARRSAFSVAANLVEGCSREGTADFRRFVEIAQGSAMELRFLLKFSKRKKSIVFEGNYEKLLEECSARSNDVVRGLINLRKGAGSWE